MRNLKSGENYLGYDRRENFSGIAIRDQLHVYTAPLNLGLNHWALAGDWTMRHQSIILNQANGRITYRFHARDMHLVMGPAASGKSIKFRVLIDGKIPGDAHGIDIDEYGNGILTEQRLYQLIRQSGPIQDRKIEIEFFEAGAEAFSFTFG